ncbi:MAG: RNase adapter RapZ [Candidatus Dormibacteraeota bacterium]|nr:RNase adapter RapZ [Candidatus Dormibacteraeota bacterium]MBV9525255.1 RNase adapter RapZ [Candidatus Dormibacteraeota bacterium]
MTLWVLTGMSGAGKATALTALERAGVRCIDNLPVALLPALRDTASDGVVAVVIDARQGDALAQVNEGLDGASVLYLDANDDVLVRRLGNSTRPHPCEALGRGLTAIAAERAMLSPLRVAADVVIDTSALTPKELQQRAVELVSPSRDASPAGLTVTVSSFGYKHGPQLDADWVVDARMIRNPFWEPALRPLTGLDPPVRDFVMHEPEARELVRRLQDLLSWACARYADHGRRYLHVAVGCTGGRHRSVVICEELATALRASAAGVAVHVRHRDMERPDPRE